jgi:hypothetical protein
MAEVSTPHTFQDTLPLWKKYNPLYLTWSWFFSLFKVSEDYYQSKLVYDRRRMRNPSYLTKIVGRAGMVSGKLALVTFSSYILDNLLYAAGPIALIAFLVVGAQEWRNNFKTGMPKYEAFKIACVPAFKAAIKFFSVYMSWIIASAFVGTSMLFTGPWAIPASILFTGLAGGMGFTLATLITDVLPQYTKRKGTIVATLCNGFMRAFFECCIWTSIELVGIYQLFNSGQLLFGNATILGVSSGSIAMKIADIAIVSYVVSNTILVGGYLAKCFRRAKNLLKSHALTDIDRRNIKIAVLSATKNDNFEDFNKLISIHPETVAVLKKYIKLLIIKKSSYKPSTAEQSFIDSPRFGISPVILHSKTASRLLLTRIQNNPKNKIYVRQLDLELSQLKQKLIGFGISIDEIISAKIPLKSLTSHCINDSTANTTRRLSGESHGYNVLRDSDGSSTDSDTSRKWDHSFDDSLMNSVGEFNEPKTSGSPTHFPEESFHSPRRTQQMTTYDAACSAKSTPDQHTSAVPNPWKNQIHQQEPRTQKNVFVEKSSFLGRSRPHRNTPHHLQQQQTALAR